jgi:hypothetical protein
VVLFLPGSNDYIPGLRDEYLSLARGILGDGLASVFVDRLHNRFIEYTIDRKVTVSTIQNPNGTDMYEYSITRLDEDGNERGGSRGTGTKLPVKIDHLFSFIEVPVEDDG